MAALHDRRGNKHGAAAAVPMLLLMALSCFVMAARPIEAARALATTASPRGVTKPCSCGNGKAKVWGPGGPHTALLPVAELFNNRTSSSSSSAGSNNYAAASPEVEVCWGPEDTWRETAMDCGAGLFSAAEQQMYGMLRTYASVVDEESVTPVTMHVAVIIVGKGNPKNITGLGSLADPSRDDIALVVNDGNFHGSLTSGTALWEDIVGRMLSLEALRSVRDKIVYVAPGSGAARDAMLGNNLGFDGKADAWIIW